MIERMYYSNPITEAAIANTIRAATARNQKPTAVILPVGCKLEISEIEGLPVTVEERVKPALHFMVVME